MVRQSHTEARATLGGPVQPGLTGEINQQHRETTSLVVSEIFGPTIQGEGPSVGYRCMFLRLGGCNLHCSWCDTPYTWDWTGRNGVTYTPSTELTRKRVWEVVGALMPPKAAMLVISGGEPLLQRIALSRLCTKLAFRRIEIETNGTQDPTPLADFKHVYFNVSPKLAHAGNTTVEATNPVMLTKFVDHPRSIFKFVVQSVDQLSEVESFCEWYAIKRYRAWVMAEGSTGEVVRLRTLALADKVIELGFNLTPRMHLDLWGPTRGH